MKRKSKVTSNRLNAVDHKKKYIESLDRTSFARDSFLNIPLKLGIGANNSLSQGGFTNENLSYNWLLLRQMYASNGITRRIIDIVAQDMTRDGVELTGSIEPDDAAKIQTQWSRMNISRRLCELVSMGRLFGGALALIVISGQDPETPLNLATIRKGQFLGLKIYDRWQLIPAIDQFDALTRTPLFYDVINTYDGFDPSLRGSDLDPYRGTERIHSSRVIRMDGDYLPYIDFIQNQRWNASIIASIYDVIISYNTTNLSMASAAYKASSRVLKMDKVYEVMNQSPDGTAFTNLAKFVASLRELESVENVTVIDREDDLQVLDYELESFEKAIEKQERQLSCVTGIPITKLFGDAPKGMNATGDNDTRMYYDQILVEQEKLRTGIYTLLNVMYLSIIGNAIPSDFDFEFCPLWQMDQSEKATIAKSVSDSISETFGAGIIDRATALKELLQSSKDTGIYSNITEEDIENASEQDPPEFDGENPPDNLDNNDNPSDQQDNEKT